MPRKTRKQKLLAEQHREKTQLPDNTYEFVKPPIELSKAQSNESNPIKKPEDKSIDRKTQIENIDHVDNHVKKDIIKISAFTFFALIFQGVLYYLLNRP